VDGGNPVYPQEPYAEQFSEKLYLPAWPPSDWSSHIVK